MSLVCCLRRQKSETSNSWASRCALSTMLRAMFSQYIPTIWPCLNRSVANSLRQFSILRERNFAKHSSGKGWLEEQPHGRRDGGEFCVQKTFSFLQMDYYRRLSSVVSQNQQVTMFLGFASVSKQTPGHKPAPLPQLCKSRQPATEETCRQCICATGINSAQPPARI